MAPDPPPDGTTAIRSGARGADRAAPHRRGRLAGAAPIEEGPPHRRLVAAFARSLQSLDPYGRMLALEDPDRFGHVAAAHVVTVSRWSAQLGRCYCEEGVAQLLGSAQPVLPAERDDLLALTTGSGQVVYPAFQFEGHDLVEGFSEILSILRDAPISLWTSASWLTSPDPELGGSAPIDALREGRRGEVRMAARHWASAVSV